MKWGSIKRQIVSAFLALLTADLCAGQSLVVLHQFSGTDGAGPYAKLVEGPDGDLYGTTTSSTDAGGAVNGTGTIFKITKAGALTTLHVFSGTNPPYAQLVLGLDGNFYGTTGYQCGSLAPLAAAIGSPIVLPTGVGTVFKITPTGEFTNLQTLATPVAGLTLGSDGYLYGVTTTSAFKITTDGTMTTLHTFSPTEGADLCKLTEGPDGNFYGTADEGGLVNITPSGGGTAYEMTPTGTVTVLHAFSNPTGGAIGFPCYGSGFDGSLPVGGLTLGANGAFYGLNYCFLDLIYGYVYSMSSAGTITGLNDFGIKDAANPSAELALGSDGLLYGVLGGGTLFISGPPPPDPDGQIFSMTANGTVTILHTFSGTDGADPSGGIIEGSDGRFYGVTGGGGTGSGTVYQLTLPPMVPTGVKMAASAGTLTISWNAMLTASSYDVFLGTAPGAESANPSRTGITGTTASITDAINGKTYYVEVAAVNAGGTGPKSAEVSAEPTAAPSGLSASAGSGSVMLKWSAAPGASGYQVYEGAAAGGEGSVPILTTTTTSSIVSGLTNGTMYYFKVKSVYGAVEGGTSNEASATPTAPSSSGGGSIDWFVLSGLTALFAASRLWHGVLSEFRHSPCRSVVGFRSLRRRKTQPAAEFVGRRSITRARSTCPPLAHFVLGAYQVTFGSASPDHEMDSEADTIDPGVWTGAIGWAIRPYGGRNRRRPAPVAAPPDDG